jgi:hypothetical protein
MTRWRASGLHLLISVAVALVAFSLVFFLWYPSPFFAASGGEKLVLLLIGIDIVIGPLLTLIVYRAGKRGMKFDLAFIGACQALALLYGLYVITAARPVFVAFAVDRFVLVPANRLDDADLAAARDPAFRARSWTGPVWVAAELPADNDERMALAFSGAQGKDIELLPKYYVPYAGHAREAVAKAHPISELAARHPGVLDALPADRRDAARIAFLPLIGRARALSVVLDKVDGTLVTVLDVSPW